MRLRTRSTLSWVLFAVGTVACLATAFGAYTLAGYSWDQVVSYTSPYIRPLETPDATLTTVYVPPGLESENMPVPGKPLSERVVLVIVDGMRDDISRSAMPSLETLRGYGSDLQLTAPQPSLSFPNWTTILTGAPQTISGVTTNWYDTRVFAPTIMDVVSRAGKTVAVVGPTDFAELYGVKPGPAVSLRPWPKGGYLSGTLVDDALKISKETSPALLVLHLPDLDEAGHSHGGASDEYREVARKIDADLSRLVTALQSDSTTFMVVADHGHVDTGGHGGWEDEVTAVPGILAGSAVAMGVGEGNLDQIASTIAVLEGVQPPTYAAGTALRSAITTTAPSVFLADTQHHRLFVANCIEIASRGTTPAVAVLERHPGVAGMDAAAKSARNVRLSVERAQRAPYAFAVLALVFAVVIVLALVAWRALVAAAAGVAVYYLIYNALFFLMHGYLWSLSAFNTETQVSAFMNARMAEAIFAAVVGVAAAGIVYPFLRQYPHGPGDRDFLSGWLALAPATVLLIQGTLALQVAWYYWYWGVSITWILPDFRWAFKADLDMVQMTALGVAAVLAPLVTYLVGRYHPRVRERRAVG